MNRWRIRKISYKNCLIIDFVHQNALPGSVAQARASTYSGHGKRKNSCARFKASHGLRWTRWPLDSLATSSPFMVMGWPSVVCIVWPGFIREGRPSLSSIAILPSLNTCTVEQSLSWIDLSMPSRSRAKADKPDKSKLSATTVLKTDKVKIFFGCVQKGLKETCKAGGATSWPTDGNVGCTAQLQPDRNITVLTDLYPLTQPHQSLLPSCLLKRSSRPRGMSPNNDFLRK